MIKPVKLEVEGLLKVFGDSTKKALEMVDKGLRRDEIFAKTGSTIGVSDANFKVYKGEIFVVMGLSGSGKSTLVRLLNRLIEPTRGTVTIDGENVTKMSAKKLREVRRKKISMVFQSFALMPHMNVLDNAAFGLVLDGVNKKQAHQRAQQALEQVGLGTQSHSFPSQLSGGMQQRVGLARALATGSELMLMDEAFSALDPLIRTEMQDELVKLQQENGNTIIFISHDLDEAIRIGDRIAIMESGEIVQIGTPEEILENPANDYVASFFKGVSVGAILTARHLAKTNVCAIPKRPGQGIKAISQLLEDSDHDFAYLTEPDKTFLGVVSMRSLKKAQSKGDDYNAALLADVTCLAADKTINEIIGDMSEATCPLPVVDEANKFVGVVTHAHLLKALDRS